MLVASQRLQLERRAGSLCKELGLQGRHVGQTIAAALAAAPDVVLLLLALLRRWWLAECYSTVAAVHAAIAQAARQHQDVACPRSVAAIVTGGRSTAWFWTTKTDLQLTGMQ